MFFEELMNTFLGAAPAELTWLPYLFGSVLLLLTLIGILEFIPEIFRILFNGGKK